MLNIKKTLTKILKQMPSVGSYDDIPSFPWTAPCDCMIEVYAYPASVANTYMSIRISDGRVLQVTAVGGTALSGEMFVKKGTVLSNYSHSNLGGGSYVGYIPLGGVINYLKKAISNLYREEVAVC